MHTRLRLSGRPRRRTGSPTREREPEKPGGRVCRLADWRRIDARSTAESLEAEEPSRVGLTTPQELPAAHLFVMQEIEGLHPWAPMSNTLSQWQTPAAPARVSTLGYATTDTYSDPAFERKAFVQVMQLPNADWARYQERYAAAQVGSNCAMCIAELTKFGQRVTEVSPRPGNDSGNYQLSFLWPSGTAFVSVTYETAQNQEEILSLYLKKYPSDL